MRSVPAVDVCATAGAGDTETNEKGKMNREKRPPFLCGSVRWILGYMYYGKK
jgi:hypothetical protein